MIDDDDGTEIRGKACENGCVCEIANGKFQPSGISEGALGHALVPRDARRLYFPSVITPSSESYYLT